MVAWINAVLDKPPERRAVAVLVAGDSHPHLGHWQGPFLTAGFLHAGYWVLDGDASGDVQWWSDCLPLVPPGQ